MGPRHEHGQEPTSSMRRVRSWASACSASACCWAAAWLCASCSFVGELEAARILSSSCLQRALASAGAWCALRSHHGSLALPPLLQASGSSERHRPAAGGRRPARLLMETAAISPEPSRLRARRFSLLLWWRCSLLGEVEELRLLLPRLGVANSESSTSLPLPVVWYLRQPGRSAGGCKAPGCQRSCSHSSGRALRQVLHPKPSSRWRALGGQPLGGDGAQGAVAGLPHRHPHSARCRACHRGPVKAAKARPAQPGLTDELSAWQGPARPKGDAVPQGAGCSSGGASPAAGCQGGASEGQGRPGRPPGW